MVKFVLGFFCNSWWYPAMSFWYHYIPTSYASLSYVCTDVCFFTQTNWACECWWLTCSMQYKLSHMTDCLLFTHIRTWKSLLFLPSHSDVKIVTRLLTPPLVTLCPFLSPTSKIPPLRLQFQLYLITRTPLCPSLSPMLSPVNFPIKSVVTNTVNHPFRTSKQDNGKQFSKHNL